VLTTITAIAIGIIMAVVARLIAGRLAGLGATAICGATIAYLLPPAFSFRVSEPRDIAALAIYGAIGLVLASPPPAGWKRAPARREPAWERIPAGTSETPVDSVIAELMGSDLGERMRAAGIAIDAGGFLPWAAVEAADLLSDVLESALHDAAVRQISIYGGRRPGDRRVFVAAYHRWPPPAHTAITIGKRHEDCEALAFPGWPSHSRASWFENGCGRVYQISREDRES